jgi:ankyrin repeat protein
MIKILLKNNTEVSIRNIPPLSIAAWRGCKDIIKLLIEGANVHI